VSVAWPSPATIWIFLGNSSLFDIPDNDVTLGICFVSTEFSKSSSSPFELIVKVALGESLHIEGKKNGESMWTYDTKRTTKRTGDVF
jgi:hypothetical protein